MWEWPWSVLESFATRELAAIELISAALSETVCAWVAAPWMFSSSAPPAVSWAPVITAEWPWLFEIWPTLSVAPVEPVPPVEPVGLVGAE